MNYKQIALKSRLSYIPKEITPYLFLWHTGSGDRDLCIQIKRKDELHNGIIINRQDAKRLTVFLADFLRKKSKKQEASP